MMTNIHAVIPDFISIYFQKCVLRHYGNLVFPEWQEIVAVWGDVPLIDAYGKRLSEVRLEALASTGLFEDFDRPACLAHLDLPLSMLLKSDDWNYLGSEIPLNIIEAIYSNDEKAVDMALISFYHLISAFSEVKRVQDIYKKWPLRDEVFIFFPIEISEFLFPMHQRLTGST